VNFDLPRLLHPLEGGGAATERLVALRHAYRLAAASPDPSTQNGAFVLDRKGTVIGESANTTTPGTSAYLPGLLERPTKYAHIEHAERGAIYAACRGGHKPDVMVAAWAACADCARAIILSGVRYLIRHDRADATGRWNESIEQGDEMMQRAGITIIGVPGDIGGCPPVLFNGEWIDA